jgi:hypothetical protein
MTPFKQPSINSVEAALKESIVMPDPVWVDTNVVSYIADGDTGLEAQLQTYSNSGRKRLIVPQARHELVYGNTLTTNPNKSIADQQSTPENRVRVEEALARIKVETDMRAANFPFAERVGLGMQDRVPRPMPWFRSLLHRSSCTPCKSGLEDF